MTIRMTARGAKLDDIYRAKCHTCGSEFEAKKEDLDIRDLGYVAKEPCTYCGLAFLDFEKVLKPLSPMGLNTCEALKES